MRIQAEVQLSAPRERAWAELIDWEGQGRWIPATTVTVQGDQRTGIGTRVEAFSGLRVGPLRLGLLDRFVVTGWLEGHEVEVLHLGPVFTGPGVFRVEDAGDGSGTRFRVIEDAELPVPGVGRVAGPAVPLLNLGLRMTLRRFARLVS